MRQWCIPKAGARFVAKMEDVLDVYQRAYDPRYPQVCLDEKSKELHADVHDPLLPQPGAVARQDYEYERQGTANLFIVSEPLRGWRRVEVTTRRTGKEMAEQLRRLVDEAYPAAEKIILVTDNLNTHGVWVLYEQFAPAEAKRIADKLEWHYTPEHGSWLNMAEIELSVLERQCLKQRMPDIDTLRQEVNAWVERRNAMPTPIQWRFTTADARIKLRRLYPVIT